MNSNARNLEEEDGEKNILGVEQRFPTIFDGRSQNIYEHCDESDDPEIFSGNMFCV